MAIEDPKHSIRIRDVISLIGSGLLLLAGLSLLLFGFWITSFIPINSFWIGSPGGGGFDVILFDMDGNRHDFPICEPEEEEKVLKAPLYAPI